MKLFFMVVCTFGLMVAQHQAADRSTQCESCLMTAREIEKVTKDSPSDARPAVVKRLLSGEVCERPVFHSLTVARRDTLTSCCRRLLEDHRDQFSAALLSREPRRLEVALCYEESSSCVGVKRHSFQNSKVLFKDSDLEALIQSNKGNMRISQPIHPHSPSKDEL